MQKSVLLFLFSSLIYLVSGSGEFIILKTPKAIKFSGNEVIDGHDISQVISAGLGFTVRKGSEWPGLSIKNPFGFANVVAVVAVEGISSLGDLDNTPTFPINPVQDEYKIWKSVEDDVLEHYPTITSNRTLLRVELGSENADLSDITVKHLDKMNDEDVYFLEDLVELKSFVDGYKKEGVVTEEAPQVNWFVLSSLHVLSDVRGANSEATLEAKKMVVETLENLGRVLSAATYERALVVAIVGDGTHTRHERAAGEPNSTTTGTAPSNRATIYRDSYPAIFNIILWFTVAFIFSLIAISYFIGNMDPGRDSIIYRMTSNRMKKDS